ncbi:MAG: metallophosphatase [Bacteroidales bacterium]|nr:metallophosphatase [Bacteroidales bacterium]MBO7488179.1 metallophosphatase [Bacteroidales bacterium]
MKKIFLAVAIACLTFSMSDAQRLVILHTNDTHSQIEPLRTGRNEGLGGVDRRLQFIDSVRHEYGKKKVLLLDAGDYNQGTPYFTMAKGDLEQALMNALGYDAITLGNHEFDNGLEELARRISTSKCPILMCNYGVEGTPLEPYVKPYTIIKRGGLKIGIVGATSYLESNVMYEYIKNMEHLDTVAEVNKWADYLKNSEKCDMVIFLSHLGFDGGDYDRPSDHVVAAESSNIDIIVGGHSHTFIDEPSYVVNKKGKEVIIVTAGAQGVEIGELKVY